MAYSGSFAITAINGNAVTEAGVYFVGRNHETGLGSAIIGGTYTGDVPVSMTGKCGSSGTVVAFTAFVAADGVWSGLLPIISAGTSLSLIALNAALESSAALVMARFNCGDFCIIAGQSNAQGSVVTNFNGSSDPLPTAYIEGSSIWWYDPATSTFKQGAPRLDYSFGRAVSLLSRKMGIPFCMVNVSIGSTAISTWLWPSGSSWLAATATLIAADVIGSGNYPFVLWWQGESDRFTHPSLYKSRLLDLVRDMRNHWGAREVLAVPNCWFNAVPIAEATIEAAIGGTTFLFVACSTADIRYDSPDYGDDIHVKRVQEATIIGDRMGQTLLWRAGYLAPAIGVVAGDPLAVVTYRPPD